MKTYLDCFPCFLNQALRAARITTDDEKKIKREEANHSARPDELSIRDPPGRKGVGEMRPGTYNRGRASGDVIS